MVHSNLAWQTVSFGFGLLLILCRNHRKLPSEITFIQVLMATRLTPSFAVVIIWQITQAWNEFLFAVILTNQAHWPVTVALNNLAGSQLVQGILR